MVIGVSVISCCLIYSILLMVIYFSKQRLDSMENKIYGVMVVINIFGLILELLCCYFTYKNGSSAINTLLCFVCNRLFIIYMLTWLSVFTFYIFYITFSNQVSIKKDLNKYKRIFLKVASFIYIILLVLAMVLPLYYCNDGTYVYSYGPATSLLVIFGGVSILFDIYCVVKNKKNIKSKQYYPLFVLIVLMIVVLIIRNINPGIILINSTFAFITMLMYFTIENPDIQMINELYKNKKLIEKSNEDTSRFLFRITQDIRKPVKEITDISNDMKYLETKEELVNAGKYINNYSNQIDYLINKVLNISNMDTQTIKVFENKYNPRNLFKEVSFRALENRNNSINFNYQVSNDFPNYLYGDSIKLKQALSSIINIAYSYTDSGFINMDASAIIKYGVCRLVITIEDSGRGVSIDRVNQILSMTSSDLKSVNISNNDNRYLDIISVKKLINMLGGSLMIKSEEDKGTVVTVTLDQRIVKDESTELSKKLERYEQSLYGDKKALVIDSDEKELVLISSILEENGITVSSSVYAKDCTEKIRNKMKYDFIILDDVLSDKSAYDVLMELKKNNDFKIPVIIMISDNKEGIKLHYMKDGFFDCIMKSKLDSELERILKRF